MKIQKINVPVKIDEELMNKALDLAKEKNIANTQTGIINFVLNQAINKEIKLNLDPESFNWNENKKTTIWIDKELGLEYTLFLMKRGLRHDYSFLVNLLTLNFYNIYGS